MRDRILIVDDDRDVRESLLDELHPRYAVTAATCGREAMAALSSSRFEAVISDLRMPDVSGIVVLEHARRIDPEVVRILLTGHLDEDAQRATLAAGAPFKIGKPWHDEIEVTLRRAFEQRAERVRLQAAVKDALATLELDDALAAEHGLAGLAAALVRQARAVRGVAALSVTVEAGGVSRVVERFEEPSAPEGEAWCLDEPLSGDGMIRVRASGGGPAAREIVLAIVARARRWAKDDFATRLARRAAVDAAARDRLMALSRRAELGAMAASCMHELASVITCLSHAVCELDDGVRGHACFDHETTRALDDARGATTRVVSLFRAMRTFLHAGERRREPCRAIDLITRAVAICGNHRFLRRRLRVGAIPPALVLADEPLVVQVLVNLLRNAAEAAGGESAIDLEAELQGGELVVAITDDGPGVPEEHVASLFAPFFTTKGPDAGTGLGLAFAAEVVREHGGAIGYQRRPGRGATFVFSLPVISSEE